MSGVGPPFKPHGCRINQPDTWDCGLNDEGWYFKATGWNTCGGEPKPNQNMSYKDAAALCKAQNGNWIEPRYSGGITYACCMSGVIPP